MAISFCKKCEIEVYYDEEIGLNVKYYAAESNQIGFRAGGDFPICPTCENRCDTQEAIEYRSKNIQVIIRKFQF